MTFAPIRPTQAQIPSETLHFWHWYPSFFQDSKRLVCDTNLIPISEFSLAKVTFYEPLIEDWEFLNALPRNDESQSMTGFHAIGATGFEPATPTTPK